MGHLAGVQVALGGLLVPSGLDALRRLAPGGRRGRALGGLLGAVLLARMLRRAAGHRPESVQGSSSDAG